MEASNMKTRGEIIFFAGCLLFFGFMFHEALGQVGHGRAGEVGSGLWPLLALGACTVLSGARLAFILLKSRQARTRRPPTDEEGAGGGHAPDHAKVALTMVSFLAYLLAIPWIGFMLGTLLFVPALTLALGERRAVVLMVSPFVLTGIILLVFARFIAIPFPKGVGIFATLSRLLY